VRNLIQGIHDFQNNVFSSKRAFFERLAKGQSPETLFITCADSRINPNLITQTQPGELFIMRNAGNIIPPHGPQSTGEAATIEYAISILNVRDVIVCGHTYCGAMSALLEPSSVAGHPSITSWLAHAEQTRKIIKDNYRHLEGDELLTAAVEENVLVQLEHVRTLPSVAQALAAGRVRLHGWVYKLETGEVFAFDPEAQNFLPVDEQQRAAKPPPSAPRRSI
jgi:carbonic anhydrase